MSNHSPLIYAVVDKFGRTVGPWICTPNCYRLLFGIDWTLLVENESANEPDARQREDGSYLSRTWRLANGYGHVSLKLCSDRFQRQVLQSILDASYGQGGVQLLGYEGPYTFLPETKSIEQLEIWLDLNNSN